MIIALMGYRGSGKTTVGRLLAQKLNLPFIDLDGAITQKAGQSIKDIFAQGGEPAFRSLETQSLLDSMNSLQRGGVLSLGGGAVLADKNQQALRTHATHRIYLHAPPETLLTRIQADTTTAANRPALTHLGGGVEEIRHLLTLREPIYRQLATEVMDATQPPEQLATQIANRQSPIANRQC